MNKWKIRGKRESMGFLHGIPQRANSIIYGIKKAVYIIKCLPDRRAAWDRYQSDVRRQPLYRADIKTISKWNLHLGFADVNVW